MQCIHRTISTDAVLVIAGTVPIEYLAEERAYIYGGGETNEARRRTIQKWQERWSEPGKGGWTRRLIPNIKEWIDRKHEEVNYSFTQCLSGHGCFHSYLNAIGKATTESCRYCGETPDTVEHAVFQCPKWEGTRMQLRLEEGRDITPDSITGIMLRNERSWSRMATFAQNVINTREADERKMQRCNNS